MLVGHAGPAKLPSVKRKMILMRSLGAALLTVSWLRLACPELMAQMQMPMASAATGFNASLAKFFGANTAFSARAEAMIQEKVTGETTTIPMGFALLGGKIRMELDLTQIKNKQLTAEAMAMVKGMGMSQMTSLILPERKVTCVVYPSLHAYVELPLGEDQGGAADLKIMRVEVGKETVEGHPCVKQKVSVTDRKGRNQEGFTWNATDLKDFPIRMEFTDTDARITMTFRNIKLSPPDAASFEAPAGFTKYADMEALMSAMVQKSIGGPARN